MNQLCEHTTHHTHLYDPCPLFQFGLIAEMPFFSHWRLCVRLYTPESVAL